MATRCYEAAHCAFDGARIFLNSVYSATKQFEPILAAAELESDWPSLRAELYFTIDEFDKRSADVRNFENQLDGNFKTIRKDELYTILTRVYRQMPYESANAIRLKETAEWHMDLSPEVRDALIGYGDVLNQALADLNESLQSCITLLEKEGD